MFSWSFHHQRHFYDALVWSRKVNSMHGIKIRRFQGCVNVASKLCSVLISILPMTQLKCITLAERLWGSRTSARLSPAAAPGRTATPSTTPAHTPTSRPCSPSTSSRNYIGRRQESKSRGACENVWDRPCTRGLFSAISQWPSTGR